MSQGVSSFSTAAGPGGAAGTSSSGQGFLSGLLHLPGDILKAFVHALLGFFTGLLTALVHFISWVPVALFTLIVHNEATIVLQQAAWAQALLTLFISVAYGLLGLRLVWELWRKHIARAGGEPVSLGGTVRGAVWAAVAIAAGPWLCLRAIEFANLLTTAVIAVLAPSLGAMLPGLPALLLHEAFIAAAGAGIAGLGSTVTIAAGAVTLSGGVLAICIALIPVLIYVGLLLALWLQMAIRSIDFLVAAFLAPFAALGYMSPNEGMASTWLTNVGILVGSQVLQVLLLYVAVGVLALPGVGWAFRLLLSIAAIIVALRGPHMLRQYTYHTGTGSMAMQGAQAAMRGVKLGG